jgi:hypothetical protein
LLIAALFTSKSKAPNRLSVSETSVDAPPKR